MKVGTPTTSILLPTSRTAMLRLVGKEFNRLHKNSRWQSTSGGKNQMGFQFGFFPIYQFVMCFHIMNLKAIEIDVMWKQRIKRRPNVDHDTDEYCVNIDSICMIIYVIYNTFVFHCFSETFPQKSFTLANSTFNFRHRLPLHTKGHRILHRSPVKS